MSNKSGTILLVLVLASGLSASMWVPSRAALTEIIVLPQHQEFGPEPCVGTLFSVTVEVHDVNNLYGLDVQFGWDAEWIGYVGHTKMIPVEQHPGGILYSPTFSVKDHVDETASMPGSNPGTMYWLAEASMLPAASFNGSGICFEMTFRINKQPAAGEPDAIVALRITGYSLADTNGLPTYVTPPPSNGEIVIHALLPPGPGDIDRNGKVDLLDVLLAASLYGRTEADPQWLPEADLAPPYGIIDISDLVTICIHYGKHYS